MAHLNEQEIARREPVWSALSELFVGRELQDYDYDDIAERLLKSGYSLAELQAILDQEIVPVFHTNLGPLALPEMMGWSAEDVKNLVIDHMNKRATLAELILPDKWLRERRSAHIRERWETVRNLLGPNA